MPERSILRFSRRKAGCFLIQKNPRQIAEGFQTSYPCGVFITFARIFPWNHGVYSANFAPGQNDSVRQFQNAHSCKRKRLWHGTHLLGCYQMQTAQPKCCPLKSKPQDKRFLCFSIALRFRKSKHLTSFLHYVNILFKILQNQSGFYPVPKESKEILKIHLTNRKRGGIIRNKQSSLQSQMRQVGCCFEDTDLFCEKQALKGKKRTCFAAESCRPVRGSGKPFMIAPP